MSYGDQTLDENLSKDEAIDLFKKTFKTKTGNEWGVPFQKNPGGYDLVSFDH